MTAKVAPRVRARPSEGQNLALVLRLGWSRTVVEVKQFFRNPQLAFFTFSLPVLLLVIFGMIFNRKIDGPPGTEPVPFRQYFVAGMIAAGVVSTTFTNLAMTISIEQHDGLLKRLSGTPLPKASYFIGKIGLAIVTSAAQTGIMLAIGATFFGLHLPSQPGHWFVFAWVFVLGIAGCSLLGIAYTRIIPNSQAASAIVQPPYLVLQFISGVFFVYGDLPPILRTVGLLFPLKWMAQGFRYVFLPDWFKAKEQGGTWDLPVVAAVLAAWIAAGFVLAVRGFRWTRESDG
jgi:ABC-2 type transport system permease protein